MHFSSKGSIKHYLPTLPGLRCGKIEGERGSPKWREVQSQVEGGAVPSGGRGSPKWREGQSQVQGGAVPSGISFVFPNFRLLP